MTKKSARNVCRRNRRSSASCEALNAANGEAAVLNYQIDEGSMKILGLKSGEVLKILNEKTDPVTTRAKRH